MWTLYVDWFFKKNYGSCFKWRNILIVFRNFDNPRLSNWPHKFLRHFNLLQHYLLLKWTYRDQKYSASREARSHCLNCIWSLKQPQRSFLINTRYGSTYSLIDKIKTEMKVYAQIFYLHNDRCVCVSFHSSTS